MGTSWESVVIMQTTDYCFYNKVCEHSQRRWEKESGWAQKQTHLRLFHCKTISYHRTKEQIFGDLLHSLRKRLWERVGGFISYFQTKEEGTRMRVGLWPPDKISDPTKDKTILVENASVSITGLSQDNSQWNLGNEKAGCDLPQKISVEIWISE